MRMAVVLPQSFPEFYFQQFQQIFQADFSEVDVEYLFYIDYKEAPGLIQERQHKFDAIIFAGAASFHYTENILNQETVWLYLPRDGSDIYRALLVAMKQGLDITRLSIDTYELPLIQEIYRELGYDQKKLRIQCFTGNARNPDYNKLALDFHRDCLFNGLVSGCITRLNTVAKMMDDASIPYIFAYPTRNTIREQIAFAQKLVIAKQSGGVQFAVLCVEIHYPDGFSAVTANNYTYAMKRMRVVEEIYRFAALVNGSVVEQGSSDYLIFSSREAVEAQLDQRLPLLDWLVEVCPYRILIGVGYGETVAHAHQMAGTAVRSCHRMRHSCAVVQAADGTMLRLAPGGVREQKSCAPAMERWEEAARKTGLSVATVAKIAKLADDGRFDSITAQRLAQELGTSRRSANRILEKLECAGYAATIGNVLSGGKGRPARAVKVFLTK